MASCQTKRDVYWCAAWPRRPLCPPTHPQKHITQRECLLGVPPAQGVVWLLVHLVARRTQVSRVPGYFFEFFLLDFFAGFLDWFGLLLFLFLALFGFFDGFLAGLLLFLLLSLFFWFLASPGFFDGVLAGFDGFLTGFDGFLVGFFDGFSVGLFVGFLAGFDGFLVGLDGFLAGLFAGFLVASFGEVGNGL